MEGFTVHDATSDALPFNPMVPPVDPQTGRANPIAHVHELGNMLQRIYKLGDQQAFQLREAMKETYEISGVGFRPFRRPRTRSTCRSRPSATSFAARKRQPSSVGSPRSSTSACSTRQRPVGTR